MSRLFNVAMAEYERLSGQYRGAQSTRIDKPAPTAKGASPDWTNEREYDRRDLVDRARQLERNSVLGEGMLSRSSESVVGNGFGLQAKSADEAWNTDTEQRWKDWCERSADARGLCTFGELLALVFRSYLRDGDVAAVLLADGSLRVVESDEIATPVGYAFPNLVDGVELNASGRPIAYHVIQNPRVMGGDRRALPGHTRVPAENVLFLARRRRIGQTRGLSAFSGVSWILDQADGNIEAVTVAARMAACFGIVLKRRSNANGLGTETGADGIARRKMRLEPGSFLEVQPDEDVKQVQAAQPTTNFPDFVNMLARIAAIPFGLPVEMLMMNFEKTNYSNARAALLQAFKVWRGHQGTLKAFCTRVYLWWLIREMESGRIQAREDALEHGWITPGWQWIDPMTEIQTTLAGIESGLETHAQALMRLGYDPAEQYAQIRKEKPILEELELNVCTTIMRDKAPDPEDLPAPAPAKSAASSESNPEILRAVERVSALEAQVRDLSEDPASARRRADVAEEQNKILSAHLAAAEGKVSMVETETAKDTARRLAELEAERSRLLALVERQTAAQEREAAKPAPVVQVDFHAPAQPAPIVNVDVPAPIVNVVVPPPPPTKTEIVVRRDAQQRIVGAEAEQRQA